MTRSIATMAAISLLLATAACTRGDARNTAGASPAMATRAAEAAQPTTTAEDAWLAAFDATCGDGSCDPPEDCNTCSQDCGQCCGNRRCEPPEDCNSCPQDCGGCCGNYSCDPPEDCNSCPQDCGPCD